MEEKMKIFRFDDICYNTNIEKTIGMANFLKEKFEKCIILFAISPLCYDVSGQKNKEAVHPSIFNPISDYRIYYNLDYCEVPNWIPEYVTKASHGLLHIDHRLLTKRCQEMSIVCSCRLIKTNIFVPPKNHWTEDTEKICKEHGIELIKFEDGWLNLKFNKYDKKHRRYYLHSADYDNIENFTKLFE